MQLLDLDLTLLLIIIGAVFNVRWITGDNNIHGCSKHLGFVPPM